MSDLDTVLAALPRLTPDEVDTVRKRLAALSSLGGATSPDPKGGDKDVIRHAAVQVLESLGLGPIPMTMVRGLKCESEHLMAWLNEYVPIKVQQASILEMGFRLLARHLTRVGAPLAPRVMLANVDKIPGLIDKAFPGYAKSRLLGLVVRQPTQLISQRPRK